MTMASPLHTIKYQALKIHANSINIATFPPSSTHLAPLYSQEPHLP
ncbi:hypothetical protein Xhom_00499 [Xenorhabdus hominickii]|uniref:Uncharacterized protein n=1 Tax=Xenorhabdus hominickii TaxID=351679 RepID=A0A2G0QE63_XENHO|nr:hypothetical protein Xhom_00499 [Xenorhabdus hominickii]